MKKLYAIIPVALDKNAISKNTCNRYLAVKDSRPGDDEFMWILPSRVIDEDELKCRLWGVHADVEKFIDILTAPAPKKKDEWEEWIKTVPTMMGLQDCMRKMPRKGE